MRRIINMILDVAREHNKADNAKCTQLKEDFGRIDSVLSNETLSEALVVGDFPLYFARTISRAVYDRYNYQTGSWKDYTYPDTLPDYSAGERFRFDEFDPLDLRREKQEARAGWVAEHRLTLAVDDFAKQIDFSNRILVNDDLGAFNNIAAKMGDSARRFEDVYVSALYDNALSIIALTALGVNYAGTGRLTTANLGIGWAAFSQRTDARGNPLNIRPKYLVIPPILELVAKQVLLSERVAELATHGINPLRGMLEIRLDPYIATAVPNVPWYLFADPNDVPAVSVVRMQGRPGPRLFAKAPDKMPMTVGGGLGTADWRAGSFLSGDIELEIEDTIGARNDALGGLVGITDAQGIYYSSGTTP